MSNILAQFSMGFKIEKLMKSFISNSNSLLKMMILTLKCVSHVTQQGCPTHLKNKTNYEKNTNIVIVLQYLKNIDTSEGVGNI